MIQLVDDTSPHSLSLYVAIDLLIILCGLIVGASLLSRNRLVSRDILLAIFFAVLSSYGLCHYRGLSDTNGSRTFYCRSY